MRRVLPLLTRFACVTMWPSPTPVWFHLVCAGDGHYGETKSDKGISVLYGTLLKVALPFGADFLTRQTTPPAGYQ
jgi:hypothetical protein